MPGRETHAQETDEMWKGKEIVCQLGLLVISDGILTQIG